MPDTRDLQEICQGILEILSHHTKEVSRTFWGPGPPYL